MKGARALLPNLALVVVSTALALGAGEWVLGRYLPLDGFLYRLDSRYHYTLAPGTRRLFEHSELNGGGRVLVTINRAGFRGDELRHGGDPRIVVYGDSCVEADYSPLEETFTRRLGDRLAAATGRPVETVNAGVNGYGPDQALRRFRDEVGWLRPVGIVLTVFADNDFGDLIRNRLYRLDADRLTESGGRLAGLPREMFDPARRNGGPQLWRRLRALLDRKGRRRDAITREEAEVRRAVALERHLERALEMCGREYHAAMTPGNDPILRHFRDHYDADIAFLPGSPPATYKRRLLTAVLGELRALAAKAKVRVLVLVVPSPIDVCDDYEIQVDVARYPDYDRRRLTSEAVGAARDAGLDALDLFHPFRAVGARDLYYRPPGEDHWNAAGQDLAARLVSERILEEGWLEPRAGSSRSEGGAGTERR